MDHSRSEEPNVGASSLPTSDSAPQLAKVTGRLRRVGGPLGNPPCGVPGNIRFESTDGTITSHQTDASGYYSILVMPGQYAVSAIPAGIPEGRAISIDGPVVVPAHGRDDVDINSYMR